MEVKDILLFLVLVAPADVCGVELRALGVSVDLSRRSGWSWLC